VWAALGPTKGHQTFMRSPSNGDLGTWQEVAGLPGAAFIYGLSVAPKRGLGDKTLYVTADGDVYKSTDHGATWALKSEGGGLRVTAVDRTDSSLVYAGGERGLFRSTNGGETWIKVGGPEFQAPSYPAESTTVFSAQWKGIHGIATDPNTPGKVWVAAYGAGRGVWVSSDRGDTWLKLRTGDAYRSVAVSPTRPDWVWVTAGDQSTGGRAVPWPPVPCVEHTQDGGKTWLDDRGNLAWPFAWQIYVDGRDRVYLGTPGMGYYWADFGAPSATRSPPHTETLLPNPALVGSLPAGPWFDISGRRIPQPRAPGVFFYRGGSRSRRVVVLK